MPMRCSACSPSSMPCLCDRRCGAPAMLTMHPLNLEQIRGAIQEYQTQLIESVKEDIKHLHDKV